MCGARRPDAGWYQIRRALEAYGDTELADFDPFKAACAALSAKLRPMVYELGLLPARRADSGFSILPLKMES